MELRSLIMGLLVAVLAFAVKTGLGWAYLWQRRGPGRRLFPTVMVVALYALVFALVLGLVRKIDLLSSYSLVEPLWRGGQTLHWVVAGLLFGWGLWLTGRGGVAGEGCPAPGGPKGSLGFLALVIPCPVCLSVLIMALACLDLYFPSQAILGAAMVFMGFVLVAAAAGLLLILGHWGQGDGLERSLGQAMALIASYFMVSALVLPQFGQIGRIYRLASYAGDVRVGQAAGGWWVLFSIVSLALLGFAVGRRKARLALGLPGAGPGPFCPAGPEAGRE
jgi:predicted transporter